MPEFWENWSSVPAENTQAPPAGAGEHRIPLDKISDTFRVVMSACAQLGVRFNGFGDMVYQTASNVYITGGTVFADAVRTGLLPLNVIPQQLVGKAAGDLTTAFRQTLYNWIYPVGRIMLWHTTNLDGSGLVWPGTNAAWQVVADTNDRLLCTQGSNTGLAPGQGAGAMFPISTMVTSPAGGHDHAVVASGSGANALPAGGFSVRAEATGNHTHTTQTYDPRRYAFCVIARIS